MDDSIFEIREKVVTMFLTRNEAQYFSEKEARIHSVNDALSLIIRSYFDKNKGPYYTGDIIRFIVDNRHDINNVLNKLSGI